MPEVNAGIRLQNEVREAEKYRDIIVRGYSDFLSIERRGTDLFASALARAIRQQSYEMKHCVVIVGGAALRGTNSLSDLVMNLSKTDSGDFAVVVSGKDEDMLRPVSKSQ